MCVSVCMDIEVFVCVWVGVGVCVGVWGRCLCVGAVGFMCTCLGEGFRVSGFVDVIGSGDGSACSIRRPRGIRYCSSARTDTQRLRSVSRCTGITQQTRYVWFRQSHVNDHQLHSSVRQVVYQCMYSCVVDGNIYSKQILILSAGGIRVGSTDMFNACWLCCYVHGMYVFCDV